MPIRSWSTWPACAAAGQPVHEVRRGQVVAGRTRSTEAGIDPGRSVVPAGAEIEVDVTFAPFEGGIDVAGTVTAPWAGDLPALRRAGGG